MVGHWLEATLTLLGVGLGRRWSLVVGRWWIGGWSLVVQTNLNSNQANRQEFEFKSHPLEYSNSGLLF
jgi:hypothetical protein